jgi:hypothetical protein
MYLQFRSCLEVKARVTTEVVPWMFVALEDLLGLGFVRMRVDGRYTRGIALKLSVCYSLYNSL